jgi:restriction system protein
MCGPILEVLREMGGEGLAREVQTAVADRVVTDPVERNVLVKSGANRAENEVAWARNVLREHGFLTSREWGLWTLTEKGWNASVTDVADLRGLRTAHTSSRTEPALESESEVEDQTAETEADKLRRILLELPPKGFEALCQRILRAAGFLKVEVTGRSSDGGINGHGLLALNDLVSDKVLFQCKRYRGAVGSELVRNFRGAMQGRSSKGLLITTGSFTKDAKNEAIRDGAPPIELIDFDRLMALMEKHEIGLKSRVVYDVDQEFFRHFMVG